jgi:hypothetical protein
MLHVDMLCSANPLPSGIWLLAWNDASTSGFTVSRTGCVDAVGVGAMRCANWGCTLVVLCGTLVVSISRCGMRSAVVGMIAEHGRH